MKISKLQTSNMGNSQIRLTGKQHHQFNRYPRKGIISALGLNNDHLLVSEKPSIFEHINHNFEFITWLIRDTISIRSQKCFTLNLQSMDVYPYQELILLLSGGVKLGAIVKTADSTPEAVGIEELSSLLATPEPEELGDTWKTIPDDNLFSLETGLVIPTKLSCYPFTDPLLKVAASAEWILEEKIANITGFSNRAEFNNVIERLETMTSGSRLLDLDNLSMLNKPSWSKKDYYDQNLRICSQSSTRFEAIKSLCNKIPTATATTTRPTRKRTIPKAVRNQVWESYCGKVYEGRCFVCESSITVIGWEAGHVIADTEGGDTTLENLRPTCLPCNRSMGKKSMWDYIRSYHPDRAKALNL